MSRGQVNGVIGAIVSLLIASVIALILLAVASPFAERCPEGQFSDVCLSIESAVSFVPMLIGPLGLLLVILGMLAAISSKL